MKMTYRHANYKTAIAVFVGVACLLIFSSTIRNWLTAPLVFLGKPLWQVADNLGADLAIRIDGFGQTKNSLLLENKELWEENKKLRVLLLTKKSLENDNVQLRTMLGKKPDDFDSIVAKVIFLPNFVPYNNLLLDVGKNNASQPLALGDLVVVDNAVLIGKLIVVDQTYSKARLISAETDLPVVIGEENIPAVANGSGAGNFTITLPKDIAVNIGDQVSVPLYNNYLIGSVGHIEKITSRPTQTILVRTPINLFQLKWVEIYHAKI